MEKTLRKSNSNSMVFGVCGGIGEYLGIDPTFIRLLLVGFTLLGGSGLFIYLIATLVINS